MKTATHGYGQVRLFRKDETVRVYLDGELIEARVVGGGVNFVEVETGDGTVLVREFDEVAR